MAVTIYSMSCGGDVDVMISLIDLEPVLALFHGFAGFRLRFSPLLCFASVAIDFHTTLKEGMTDSLHDPSSVEGTIQAVCASET